MNVNLFLFPFAGGACNSYSQFVNEAPSEINCIPLEIPGRGSRLVEPLLTGLNDIAEDIFFRIKNNLDMPYIFFGHSMGALLSYLVSLKVDSSNLPSPQHLFLTACGGPMCDRKKESIHHLEINLFMDRVREYGGINEKVINEKYFIKIFEPVIRADFKAVETYEYVSNQPLHTPITVAIGLEDKITKEDAEKWSAVTTAPFRLITYGGNHFFIFRHTSDIFNEIKTIANSNQ